MRKIPLLLTVLSVSLSFSLVAQNDSTRLDAGGLVLKRAFTQHISIKGEDLEKMPFANLTDAINVWINGAYTISTNLIYVVDGNIISDVNAYSVHDIEEVVFLQNAGALTTTAGSQQEMVLITTRRNKGKLNIRGAAQTFLIHSPGSTTNLYHQYYAGVDANYDKFSVGVSANYLRDADPSLKPSANTTVNEPLHLDRWRLNGSFAWRPDTKNTVEVHVGYVPQTMASAQIYSDASVNLNFDGHTRELDQQLNTWARWRGQWLPGLRNDLQAGYLHMTEKGMINSVAHFPDSSFNEIDSSNLRTHQFFVRDRLSYTMQAGGWSFEPAVNASYNYIKDIYTQSQAIQTGSGGILGGMSSSYSIEGEGGVGKLWVLTPTLDISYKQVLNIQGGVVANLSKNKPDVGGVSLPGTSVFGSIAIDVLRLDGVKRTNSLKLFGSWAERSTYYNLDFNVNDVDGANAGFRYGVTPYAQPIFTGGPGPGTTPIQFPSITIPKYWVWEAGAGWSALQSRLQIDYNFQRRNFSALIEPDISSNPLYSYLLELTTSQQRLGISYRILDHADLSWQSGVNVTQLVTTTHLDASAGSIPALNDKPSYTGGWTNRVQCHRLSLGMDLLYHTGDVTYIEGYQYVSKKEDYWVTQNIYVGYKLTLPKKKGLEVYVDSRGLVRGGGTSSSSVLLNARRYYGIGGNISL